MMCETTTVIASQDRRVGKAQRAHHPDHDSRNMVGTAQERLCPPYAVWPANAGAPPLPGGERVGVRGGSPSIVRSPLTRFAPDDAAHRREQSDLSPLGRGERSLRPDRFKFVGWAKRSVPTIHTDSRNMVGTAQARLCPPYAVDLASLTARNNKEDII
jgi:hypothetical protein